MRIAVYGSGGVGGYFGGRLALSGEEVIFIARGEHLRAIQSRGLKVESIKGDFIIQPAQATDDPFEVGGVDAIILGVKAWQVAESAEAMRPMVSPDTFILPLQNGVEAPAQLVKLYGEKHVLGGLCRISSAIVEPGVVRHTGIEPMIAFNELSNRPSLRVEELKAAFDRAGVKADIPADIHAAMWEKFVFIAAISGVGAAAGAPVGVLRGVPETRRMLVQAMKETVAVARAMGVNISNNVVQLTMANIDGMAPGVTASMQRDILEGRPSELEYQNGSVVRMGKQAGVATPVHDCLYSILLPKELKARGELED